MNISSFRALVLLISLLIINSGCESKPVSVDLGENGYQVASFSAFADSSRTINDHTSHGVSSRLYLGALDSTRNSSILLRFNRDILGTHPDICSLPSDSIHYKSAFVHLKSISHFSDISDHDQQNQESSNQNENFPDGPDLNQVRAFWVDVSQYDLDWDETSIFTYLPNDIVTLGNTNVDLSQLENDPNATELPVVYVNSGIKVHLKSIEDEATNSIMLDSLCSTTSNNDYAIILHYNSPNDLIEFYSSNYSTLSGQPYFKVKYEKYLTNSTAVNKYEIEDVVPIAFSSNGFVSVLDTTYENWGSIIAMEMDPDDPAWYELPPPETLISPIGYTETTFELLSFQIRPIFHDSDSTGKIIFYLSDVILANIDLDPSDDNFNILDSTGTEDNIQFDEYELFFDCGEDGICDEDETGYQPDGTEGNLIWDDGELFSDTGVDSLFNWEEPDYDPLTNPDPNGDDFNDDPSQDDWRDCGADDLCPDDDGYTEPDEGELNELWDIGEGLESNGHFDETELFWDYGLDGVEDINEPGYHETMNPDPSGDNWSSSDTTGTEGNGIFDWIDQNDNAVHDVEDMFEVFMDAGPDTLWSYSEEGYNPYGKEGDGVHNLNEPFEDCGVDQFCDENPDEDDFVPDPVGDNFNSSDSTGTEANGALDWTDGNGNGIWDSGEGEEWFDWGVDQIQNESEPFNGGRQLQISQSPHYFELNYPDEVEAQFEDLSIDTENGEEAAIWVSSVSPILGTDFLNVTISMNTTLPLHGFQLRLKHVPFMFSHTEFADVNTSLWQLDSEKIIDDISLYDVEVYQDSTLELQSLVSYGLNLKTYLDFYGLQDFIAENPEAIISKAVVHFWIDTTHSDVHNNMVITLNRLTDFISLPADTLPMEPIKSLNLSNISNSSEILFDLKPHVQNLSYGVYSDYGLILEGNHNAYNFSLLTLYNHSDSDSLKPKLEILYSK